MPSSRGWIKIHYSILDHEVSQDNLLLGLWVRMLMEANWKDSKKPLLKQKKILKRGQFCGSWEYFSSIFNLSVQKLRSRFKWFENQQMITRESTWHGHIITICNYEKYQHNPNDEQQQNSSEPTSKKQQNNNIRRREEYKKEKHDAPVGAARSVDRTTDSQEDHPSLPGDSCRPIPLKPVATASAYTHQTTQRKSAGKRKRVIHEPSPSDHVLARDWYTWAVMQVSWRSNDKSWSPVIFAGAIEEIRRKLDLTDDGMRRVFNFICSDDFWRKNAISPRGLLRKKAGKDMRKIDHILVKMKNTKSNRELEAIREWAMQE